MSQVTDETIMAVANDIVAEISPDLVYLFGSRARGDARVYSDVDLMAIAGETFGGNHIRHTVLRSSCA